MTRVTVKKLSATANFGSKGVTQEDLQRAVSAAESVLAGHDIAAVEAEFTKQADAFYQQEEVDDLDVYLKDDAALWWAAHQAAKAAFMDGGSKPHPHGCMLHFN